MVVAGCPKRQVWSYQSRKFVDASKQMNLGSDVCGMSLFLKPLHCWSAPAFSSHCQRKVEAAEPVHAGDLCPGKVNVKSLASCHPVPERGRTWHLLAHLRL